MKFKPLLVSALLIGTLGTLAACGSDEAAEEPKEEVTEQPAAEEKADAVAAASITADPAEFAAALGEDGTWIVAALADITLDEEVVVAGEFHDKDDATQDVYRKLALYTQDDDHNVTGTFTLTVPKMTVESPNFKIQNGTVKGDVYVNANGFTLTEDTTIDGNLYFASEDVKSAAVIEGTVTGAQEVSAGEADVVTTASIVNDADALVKALSADGTWIVATLSDITVDEEIVVDGEFYDKNDKSKGIYRKLAPYTQDKDHNVLERFTVTVPKMTVKSENFKVQAGTVKGDVYVEANGFTLTEDATIDGNVYFASEDVKSASVIEGKVTGAQEVK